MFPFPADPLHLFDKSLLNHHGASLPFPPLKLDASSPLFPLSPLIFDHELLNDITLIAPPPQISPPSPPPPPTSPPDIPPTHKHTVPSPATKAFCGLDKCRTTSATKVVGGGSRRLRKDRHSKIYTAQGPRDRRMRLSLDVARKFFDLQDMLGFDKASKTVDWLLTSCKTSILELTGSSSPPADPPVDAGGNGAKSESSTSEGEVISTSTNHSPAPARAKRAALRRPRNASVHPPPSRESRMIARARARERTREKKMQQREFEGGGQGKRLASSSSPFETAGEESGTHTTKSSLELVAEEGQPSPGSPDQYHKRSSGASPPVITGTSGPISIFDYNHDIVHNGDAISLIEEQWDIQPSGNPEEQRVLLADAQWQPWFWEAFNPSI